MAGRLPVLTACVLLAVTGCSAASQAPGASHALVASPDGSGELCAVTDADGLATVAWEEVSNATADSLTVQSITVAGPGIELVEWSTLPRDWAKGGVHKGDLLSAGEGTRQVDGGDTALLVMVLRNAGQTQPPSVTPTVVYEDVEGARGTLELTWSVTLAPPGEVCQTR